MARNVRSHSTRVAGSAFVALVALAITVTDLYAQTPPPTAPGQPAAQGRGGGGGGGRGGRGGVRNMTLTSTAFADGGAMPDKYSQPGRDVSPALAWSGAPDSTVSFALIVHDLDAPIGDGTGDTFHWMVWGIPGTVTSLPEGIPQGPIVTLGNPPAAPPGGGRGGAPATRQLSVSGPYYRGPAAPSTGPSHHYLFELYALDVNINVQAAGQQTIVTRDAVFDAIKTHVRGKGVLMGTFRRAAP